MTPVTTLNDETKEAGDFSDDLNDDTKEAGDSSDDLNDDTKEAGDSSDGLKILKSNLGPETFVANYDFLLHMYIYAIATLIMNDGISNFYVYRSNHRYGDIHRYKIVLVDFYGLLRKCSVTFVN